MIERIKAIMNHYNLSVNAFSAKIGANQVTINQQMNGDRKVSLDTIIFSMASYRQRRNAEIIFTQREIRSHYQ